MNIIISLIWLMLFFHYPFLEMIEAHYKRKFNVEYKRSFDSFKIQDTYVHVSVNGGIVTMKYTDKNDNNLAVVGTPVVRHYDAVRVKYE